MNGRHSPAPFVEELPRGTDPVEVFQRLAADPHVVFFDSALRDPRLGNYSFVAADPFALVTLPHDAPARLRGGDVPPDGFTELQARMRPFETEKIVELPPFQGGAAGLFGYDLGRRLESVAATRFDEFRTPPLHVGLYDVVVAFDHAQDRAWIISQGFPETVPARRIDRAAQRGRELVAKLEVALPLSAACERLTIDRLPPEALAPQHVVEQADQVCSNFSRNDYLRTVDQVIAYIYAGDIFQANLSQRLLTPTRDSAVDLYLRLRERNAATFAGFYDLGYTQIISASPERLLQVRDSAAETRPIKGTRSRRHRPEADLFTQDELQLSEKDRAENVMIVDLLRNDLSKHCQPDSIAVTQLCEVEVFQYVHHLVSAVTGKLLPGADAIDLLRGAFPGGSITGAPKVRAMEIIAELEPTARGAYCGSLGYWGFDGTLDTNILIRTITANGGWWQMPVGGGIVADSVASDEYEETWQKAEGLLRAL